MPLGLSGGTLFPLEPLPARQVLLAIPPFGVSSAEAFAWFADRKATRPSGTRATLPIGRKLEWRSVAALAANDLEGVVSEHHPEIGSLRDALRRDGAILAQMSGSGSTVFGVFGVFESASGAVEASGARIIRTRTLEMVASVELG